MSSFISTRRTAARVLAGYLAVMLMGVALWAVLEGNSTPRSARGAGAPVFTSSDTVSYAENGAGVVINVQTNDEDAGGGVDASYAIVTTGPFATANPDFGLFTIDADDGELRFNASPNFESPADSNNDNVYFVAIRATDTEDNSTSTQQLQVTVTNVNEVPVFSTVEAQTAAENQTAVVTVSATDPDAGEGATTYAKNGGDDEDSFNVAVDGTVTFLAAPNFEVLADDDGDGVYEVTVRATSAGADIADLTLLVTVTNVNEAPVITTGAADTLAENSGVNAVVETLARTDVDAGETVVWSRVAGEGDDDNGLFNIDTADLRLTADTDFETPICGDNVCQVRVRATDAGGLTAELAMTITITNVDEAPTGLVVTGTPGGFNFAITAPAVANMGTIQYYTYEVSVGGSWNSTLSLTTNSSVGGLAGSTAYNVRVAAVVGGVVQDYVTGSSSTTSVQGPAGATGPQGPAGIVITFGNNQSNVADRIERKLRRIGGDEIRNAQSAIVIGYRSPGGSKALARNRAISVANQLLQINPSLRITTRVGGVKVAPQCAAAKNQCALVQLGS